jgi:ribosomal protein S18 acetylase RimI-like enzyme
MSPFEVRNMQPDELPRVNHVLSKAFSKARLDEGYSEWEVPLCRLGFLRMYLEGDPEGCLVVERREQLVGYVFSRLWGRVGWFGPLSVIPEEGGMGIGKTLVQRTVDRFLESGARTVGLETNPRSNRNVGFYTRLGFEPSQLVVEVARTLSAQTVNLPAGYRAVRVGRAPREQAPHLLAVLQDLTSAACRDLDYRAEVELIVRHSYGDALLLFESDTPVGAALAHTEPYAETERRAFLKVFVLLLHPSRPQEDLHILIKALEGWGKEEFMRGLTLRVPTRCSRALRLLLESEFNIVHTDLRMVLRGYEERDDPETIHFSKWE